MNPSRARAEHAGWQRRRTVAAAAVGCGSVRRGPFYTARRIAEARCLLREQGASAKSVAKLRSWLADRSRLAAEVADGQENENRAGKGRSERAGPFLDRMRWRLGRVGISPKRVTGLWTAARSPQVPGGGSPGRVPLLSNLGYSRLVSGAPDLEARMDVIRPEIRRGAARAGFCGQVRIRAGGRFVLVSPARAAGCRAARTGRRASRAVASRGGTWTRPLRRGIGGGGA